MTTNTRDRDTQAIPMDTIFKTLSHPIRRRILTKLSEHQPAHSDPVSIGELTPAESTDQRFIRRLYHNHLPHLDTAGFITWNPDAETIAPGPNYDAIHPVITLLETNQDALPTDWP